MNILELRLRRKRLGIGQDALARAMGCNKETIIDIERARIGIDEDTLNKISEALDLLAEAQKVTA